MLLNCAAMAGLGEYYMISSGTAAAVGAPRRRNVDIYRIIVVIIIIRHHHRRVIASPKSPRTGAARILRTQSPGATYLNSATQFGAII